MKAGHRFNKDLQYYKFCLYGFLKNLRFFDPFILLFFLEQGISYFQIGILFSIKEITRNVLEIPAGIFADSYGKRKSMILAFSAYIVSFLLFYFFPAFAVYIIAYVLYAIGDAFRTGTHKALIFEYLKIKGWGHQKVDYYGHTRSWSQIGSAISAIIAGVLVLYTGSFRIIFLVSAIPYVLDLINLASYPANLDGIDKNKGKKDWKVRIKETTKTFMVSFKEKTQLKSIGNISIFSGFYRSGKDYVQTLIAGFALSLPLFSDLKNEQKTALLIAFFYFAIFLLSSYASRSSGKYSRKKKNLGQALNATLLLGIILIFISGFLFHYDLKLPAIVIFSGVFMLENLRKPIGVSYISENTNSEVLSSVLSVESQVNSVFAALFAPLIGFFADHWGPGISLMVCSLSILLLFPALKVKNKT